MCTFFLLSTILVLVDLIVGVLTPLSTLFQLYRGTGVPRENHRPVAVTDKLYHIMLNRVHLVMIGMRTHNFSDVRH